MGAVQKGAECRQLLFLVADSACAGTSNLVVSSGERPWAVVCVFFSMMRGSFPEVLELRGLSWVVLPFKNGIMSFIMAKRT